MANQITGFRVVKDGIKSGPLGISGGGGTGGHVIINSNGIEMIARSGLQFAGNRVSVTDDSVNDKTIVTITNSNANDIRYDNTSSGLTADDVQEAIDELTNEKINKSGDTMSGDLTIDTGGTTSNLIIGNGTSKGALFINNSGHSTKLISNVTGSDKEVIISNLNGYLAFAKQIYPVGTIIISTSATKPSDLIGYWTQIGGGTLAGKTVYYYECTSIW